MSGVIAFVDRDVALWRGTPFITWGIGMLPLLVWAMVIGRPGDAQAHYLWPMIGFAASCLMFGAWRMMRFEWNRFKQLRALGAAELRERKNG